MSGVAKSAVHGGFPLGFAYGTLSNSTQASNVANSHTHPAGLTLLRKVYNGVAPPDGERVVGGGGETQSGRGVVRWQRLAAAGLWSEVQRLMTALNRRIFL